MKYKVLLLALFPLLSFSQNILKGMVMDGAERDSHKGLAGASVYWLNSNLGTVTNNEGIFNIEIPENNNKLVISYIGYNSDTLTVDGITELHHTLVPSNELSEVVVVKEREAMRRSLFQSKNVITVDSKELLKAACCNLAESFETNPSIDVNFSDALTGTRQIRMLGLKSPYILINQENIPQIRGAAQAYGLSFTPGTWIESIQITKGAGSVINGYESMTGQINTELKKPLTDDLFFLNLYGSLNGRVEGNVHYNSILNDKWSTGFYIHANRRDHKFDNNDDGFLDMPLANQINVMNRWQYQDSEKGWISFINIRFLNDEKQTGQTNFNPYTDKLTTNSWGSEIDTRRFETSNKLGYVFPETPYQSIGLQTSYSLHHQDSYFGLNTYNIQHESLFSSLMFNSIIGDTRHKFKTGVSFSYDAFDELVISESFNRIERNFGLFFEYTYDNIDKVNLSLGARLDDHNLLGTFFTPRLHLRYTPFESTTVKISAGRGKRSANIFAENQQYFASSRAFQTENTGGNIYGLQPEIAWNYGISILQKIYAFNRLTDFSVDFYRTDFTEQVVVDLENPDLVRFYNLNGNSYANSLQVEWSLLPFKNFETRLAYRLFDVKTDYESGTLEKPLLPKHRFFVNFSYLIPAKIEYLSSWKFDATFNRISKQRYPSTVANAIEYRLPEKTKPYSTLNAQVTKVFSEAFEIYVGGENITNTKQEHPILDSNDPFGDHFDTGFVYGPIFGSMYYAGLRFKLN